VSNAYRREKEPRHVVSVSRMEERSVAELDGSRLSLQAADLCVGTETYLVGCNKETASGNDAPSASNDARTYTEQAGEDEPLPPPIKQP
jgi:hypothetical protein